jgi:hypothetical protein
VELLKREMINLETICHFEEHGQEKFYGCRLYGENVPFVGTDVYKACFFEDLREYFGEERDLGRRIRKFESMTGYEFVVLDTYPESDVYDFKNFDLADIFVIEFTLKEKAKPEPKKLTLCERIKRYFR